MQIWKEHGAIKITKQNNQIWDKIKGNFNSPHIQYF